MSDVVHYSEMWRTACGLKDWDFGSMDWPHVTCPDCLRAELRRLQAIEKAATALFQKCSVLCLEDMDKLEAEINAMSKALESK